CAKQLWPLHPPDRVIMPELKAPDLAELFVLFPPTDYLRALTEIAADEMPQPYRGLLVHEQHMTVTVEAHHGGLVDVRVLDERRENERHGPKAFARLKKTRKMRDVRFDGNPPNLWRGGGARGNSPRAPAAGPHPDRAQRPPPHRADGILASRPRPRHDGVVW